MKKVVLFFGIVAAVALASCGNKQANVEPAVDSTAIVVVEEEIVVVEDTTAAVADSTVQVVEEVVAQ